MTAVHEQLNFGEYRDIDTAKSPVYAHLLAFLLEETAREILPEAVLACCVSGIIHVRCGYYRWGSRDAIRYSDIDAASVCIGSHSAG